MSWVTRTLATSSNSALIMTTGGRLRFNTTSALPTRRSSGVTPRRLSSGSIQISNMCSIVTIAVAGAASSDSAVGSNSSATTLGPLFVQPSHFPYRSVAVPPREGVLEVRQVYLHASRL